MDRRADVRKPERMPEYGTFKATDAERVPSFYYLPPTPDRGDRPPARARGPDDDPRAPGDRRGRGVSDFRQRASRASSKGTRSGSLKGSWVAAEGQLPAGTLRVDMSQPLARLAFYLIEPRSDDGLVDWNILDEAIGESKVYPIVRSRN